MKGSEDIRQHFIDRLKERHGIIISQADYAIINARRHSIMYRKGMHKRLVKVTINDRVIPALYSSEYEMLLTVYPADMLTNEESFLRACFASRIHPIVFMVYQFIKRSIVQQRREFTSEKAAALYFNQECTFPTLMMSLYKSGAYPIAHLARIVNDIIEGRYRTCELTIRGYGLQERKERLEEHINWRDQVGLSNSKTAKMKGLLRTLQEPRADLGKTAH